MRPSTRRGLAMAVGAAVMVGCARPHVMPLHPPPYRVELTAPYEKVWRSLIVALANENTPLRAVAKDSGVIASDDIVTPIGVYADCGRFGGDGVEGEVVVAFTVFVQPQNSETTQLQVNSKMSSASFRTSWWQRHPPMLHCASTGRWESNLFDAVRRLIKEQRE